MKNVTLIYENYKIEGIINELSYDNNSNRYVPNTLVLTDIEFTTDCSNMDIMYNILNISHSNTKVDILCKYNGLSKQDIIFYGCYIVKSNIWYDNKKQMITYYILPDYIKNSDNYSLDNQITEVFLAPQGTTEDDYYLMMI